MDLIQIHRFYRYSSRAGPNQENQRKIMCYLNAENLKNINFSWKKKFAQFFDAAGW
jgi:hypothetical protein